jgi:hypothetical protein
MSRDAWQIRIETQMRLSCNRDAFLLQGSLRAWEGANEVCRREEPDNDLPACWRPGARAWHTSAALRDFILPMTAMGQQQTKRHQHPVGFTPESGQIADISVCPLCAMCGRLRVGKAFLHVCRLVGAAMCSACLCGSHDRWP